MEADAAEGGLHSSVALQTMAAGIRSRQHNEHGSVSELLLHLEGHECRVSQPVLWLDRIRFEEDIPE